MDELHLQDYDYVLPKELIRRQGVEPRDAARLFVYDTQNDTITHATVADLPQFLPENSVMVLNNTTVVPARLFLKKETGGKIEVFVLANEFDLNALEEGKEFPVLVDRKCMVGWKLYFPNKDYLEVVRQEDNKFFVVLYNETKNQTQSPMSLSDLLQEYGETPIPHYLEDTKPKPRTGLNGTLLGNETETELRKRYQTIFANDGASVAAPTASLHFTQEVFMNLDAKGTEFAEVTLDVGLGTFAPLKEHNFETGALHEERISISEETADMINTALHNHRPIIAVGTTALRTLESCAVNVAETPSSLATLFRGKNTQSSRSIQAYTGSTDIFIYPPYEFRAVDILMTNFHLPKTSLMLLVEAFLQHKGAKRSLKELYEVAIKEEYAFYSFGDSMLIL